MSARVKDSGMLALEPRVQLLPPVVKQRERVRRTRRLLVFAVVVAIAVVGGGTAISYLYAREAEASLQAEHDRTALLLAQQAQFSEATKINTLVAETKRAQKLVTSTQVDWIEIFAELSARLPAGYGIEKASIKGPAPWETPLVPTGVLRDPGVAFVTVDMTGAEYRSAADFAHVVSFLDGVSDFMITRTDLGSGGYTTVMTFTLDLSRLSLEFLDEAEQAVAGDDEIVSEAAAAPEQTPAPVETEEASE